MCVCQSKEQRVDERSWTVGWGVGFGGEDDLVGFTFSYFHLISIT